MNKTAQRPNPWNAYSRSLHSQGIFAESLFAVAIVATMIFASTAYFSLLGRDHMKSVLIQNARSTVSASCQASAELIDTGMLFALKDPADVAEYRTQYDYTLYSLQQVQISVGANRVYVIRQVNDQYMIVFDTMNQNAQAFTFIELTESQAAAFDGRIDLDIKDPSNSEAGMNCGSLPLRRAGSVIGLVCVEFNNQPITSAYNTSQRISRLLLTSLGAMMVLLFATSVVLFRQNRMNQQQLFDMANKDMNTGLPNRRYLFTYLADRFDNPSSTKLSVPMAAFFVDIDNFKNINDNVGHAEGDRYLTMTANLLSDYLNRHAMETRRECLTARLGGDEFVQLLADIDLDGAREYAKNIIDEFDNNPDISKYAKAYNISLSVGVSMYPDHTTHYNDLVKYADIAMYYSKQIGKRTYTVYDPDMGESIEGVTLSVREARARPGA
ncbi:MAG: GGDEF domain-containing protein [Coriobacteriia bacterium]|nr:GGDEF domain-containing protein [Coriobacteriia bacterium]